MTTDRLFSVYNVNGTLTNPELAYPWRHEYIPIWLSGLLSILVPVVVYILMSLRIRSFWDLNNAVCNDISYIHHKEENPSTTESSVVGIQVISLTSLDHGYEPRHTWCHRLPAHHEDACRRFPPALS